MHASVQASRPVLRPDCWCLCLPFQAGQRGEDLQVSHALERIAAVTLQPALGGGFVLPSLEKLRARLLSACELARTNPQAALGGDPTRLGEVKAYLRVRERDAALDFDAPGGGGVDTSWQRVFLCLRSGFGQEALQARRAPPPGAAGARRADMRVPCYSAGCAPVHYSEVCCGAPLSYHILSRSALRGSASQACVASALSPEAARLALGRVRRELPHGGAPPHASPAPRTRAGVRRRAGRRRAGGAGAARRRRFLAGAGGVGGRRHRGRPAVGRADRAAPPRPLPGVAAESVCLLPAPCRRILTGTRVSACPELVRLGHAAPAVADRPRHPNIEGSKCAALAAGPGWELARRQRQRLSASLRLPPRPGLSYRLRPAAAAQTEAERLLRSADRAAWQRDGFRHRAALLVLLSGDRRSAEQLLRARARARPRRCADRFCIWDVARMRAATSRARPPM
jgi:hypothetical protein